MLCTSQGLVMAERSQAVIIMALDTDTIHQTRAIVRLHILVNSICLSFLCPLGEERSHFPNTFGGGALKSDRGLNPASVNDQEFDIGQFNLFQPQFPCL